MFVRVFVLLIFPVYFVSCVTDTEEDIICTLSEEGFLNKYIANVAFFDLYTEDDVVAVVSKCNIRVALKVLATTTTTTTTSATTTTTTTTPAPVVVPPKTTRRRRFSFWRRRSTSTSRRRRSIFGK